MAAQEPPCSGGSCAQPLTVVDVQIDLETVAKVLIAGCGPLHSRFSILSCVGKKGFICRLQIVFFVYDDLYIATCVPKMFQASDQTEARVRLTEDLVQEARRGSVSGIGVNGVNPELMAQGVTHTRRGCCIYENRSFRSASALWGRLRSQLTGQCSAGGVG